MTLEQPVVVDLGGLTDNLGALAGATGELIVLRSVVAEMWDDLGPYAKTLWRELALTDDDHRAWVLARALVEHGVEDEEYLA